VLCKEKVWRSPYGLKNARVICEECYETRKGSLEETIKALPRE
jgi:phage-related protein